MYFKYFNSIRQEQEDPSVWLALEDNYPMELEDKWGKKVPHQYGLNLSKSVGVQTHKKNWCKIKRLDCFTIEMWLKPISTIINHLIIAPG